MEGIAFRHGDIVRIFPPICARDLTLLQEDILAELLKQSGSGLFSMSRKFGGLDIKRVYFGYVCVCFIYRSTLKISFEPPLQQLVGYSSTSSFLMYD